MIKKNNPPHTVKKTKEGNQSFFKALKGEDQAAYDARVKKEWKACKRNTDPKKRCKNQSWSDMTDIVHVVNNPKTKITTLNEKGLAKLKAKKESFINYGKKD